MKIRKSIESLIKKSAQKKTLSKLRQDIVRRAIEESEFERLEFSYKYSDDYSWDDGVFGQGEASKSAVLENFRYLKPSCWMRGQKKINGKQCYEICIDFHSNLFYSMYVPVA